MPEMYFRVRWPDGQLTSCYSPSLVVKDFLTPGQSYPLADFLARSGLALAIASERVREKYGFTCSRSSDQWARIQQLAATFPDSPGAQVTVLDFDEDF